MSIYTTPLLYINMGGEMLYVLKQRLTAQGIDFTKSTQVLDDVTAAMLNPKILSTVFEPSPPASVPCIRSTLECVALSSIMRLDKASMNKLFDLMIMLTKYQLAVSTGPREIILLTLNHVDAMREIVTDENAHRCINLLHQMIIDLYGNMTMGQVWQTRNDCLEILDGYRIRVSVLLKLGLQNNDGSFNLTPSRYNENYTKYQDVLNGVKLNDVDCDNCSIGSFALFGNRGTLLGKNIYSLSYGQPEYFVKHEEQSLSDHGIKMELKMLEAQLGVEEKSCKKTFNLKLFTDNDNENSSEKRSGEELNASETKKNLQETANDSSVREDLRSNKEYRNTLKERFADIDLGVEEIGNINLLDLLDKIE